MQTKSVPAVYQKQYCQSCIIFKIQIPEGNHIDLDKTVNSVDLDYVAQFELSNSGCYCWNFKFNCFHFGHLKY